MKKLYQFQGAIPFFAAVFLNAFVDLGHKIIIQNTVFKTYDGNNQVVLIAIVNGLILLPFILLFSPAGFVNDKYPKTSVMRFAAWGAVVLTSLITLFYYLGYFWLAFAMTFMLAVQSAFYSPAKYGYLKSFFGKPRLAEANGVVQAISIVAILSGTLIYSSLFEMRFPTGSLDTEEVVRAIAPIGFLLIANSIFELFMVYRVRNVEGEAGTEQFPYRDFFTGRFIKQSLQPLAKRPVIRLSILGLAMFWSIGQVMLAVFPPFAKETLDITNTVVIQGILAASGLGIALGSFLAGKISKNHIETGLIPVGAVGIALCLWLIPTLDSALAHGLNYFTIGIMGGLFLVPLNAMIQFHAGEHELGKILASNNLFQNIAMLSFLIVTALVATLGLSSRYMLILIACVAVAGGAYTIYQLPQSLLRFLLGYMMSRRYRIRVQGIKNIPSQGGVLLLGNHISWIDWAIVQIACPRPIRFVMLASIYQRWYLRWFFKLAGCVPIAQGASSQQSLEQVAGLLNAGQVVCLFPEGTISRTGHLASFRAGYLRATALVSSRVQILPFYLRGLWGSYWSRSSEWLKQNRKPGLQRDLIVAFGEPLPKDTPTDLLKRRVFDLSIASWNTYAEELPSLPGAWLKTIKTTRPPFAIVDTGTVATGSGSTPVSGRQLLADTLALSARIRYLSQDQQNIGVLLPPGIDGASVNMAVLMSGKTVVNLDHSRGMDGIRAAIQQADITSIYTSRAYLEQLNRDSEFNPSFPTTVIYSLEDIRQSLLPVEKIHYQLATWLPAWLQNLIYCHAKNASATAAILFSHREGGQRGVRLSHRNIMANLKQVADVLNIEADDVAMGSLPLYHALGLTVTQFLPLLEGLPLVCHPDPADMQAIAKSIARYHATVYCSTPLLLEELVAEEKVHPLMLDSLRLVVSGGGKLPGPVREAFLLKFHRDILEGYGATETTPVASVNLPDALDMNSWHVQRGQKPGTVGMPLPGTSIRIVDPDSLAELLSGEPGLILIGGAQVMQGYLDDPEITARAIRQIDGILWYITGDRGYLDEDGFLFIKE